MELTALCFPLSLNVLFLLCALDQRVGSVFLRVVANRLQFFEYETLTFLCEGLKGEELSCRPAGKIDHVGSSCFIQNAFPEDSGEYWCETGAVKSNSVNITVTAGSVILESPVLPVAEGDDVALRCRNKKTSSDLTADLYKDGLLVRSSSTGNFSILNVSKSDEGLYKCSISDGGESPESWMTVGETSPTSSSPTSSSHTSSSATWIVVTFFFIVLLLAVGLLHFGKDYWQRALLFLSTLTLGPGSAEDQAVSVEANAADADNVLYAAVSKNRRKKGEDELLSRPLYYVLEQSDTQQLAEAAASTNPSSKENFLYSTIP